MLTSFTFILSHFAGKGIFMFDKAATIDSRDTELEYIYFMGLDISPRVPARLL